MKDDDETREAVNLARQAISISRPATQGSIEEIAARALTNGALAERVQTFCAA